MEDMPYEQWVREVYPEIRRQYPWLKPLTRLPTPRTPPPVIQTFTEWQSEKSPPKKKRRAKKGEGYGPAKLAQAWQAGDPCVYCGDGAETWDHLDSRKRGGPHLDNLAPACMSCNAEKSSRNLLQFLALRAQRKRGGTWRKHPAKVPKYP